MKTSSVALSSKYQVVIPKAARQKMGLDKTVGRRLRVGRVTKDEIVFHKEPSLEDFLGAFGDSFPKNATAALRKIRDEEWD